jgi:hypothetical protein
MLAMLRDISEADWKVLRQLKPIALERFCQQVLDEIGSLASDTSKTTHERYLAVFKRIEKRDRELAEAFDGLRRSTALQQLACMQSHGLLTEEEMARFSPQTRGAVALLTAAGGA